MTTPPTTHRRTRRLAVVAISGALVFGTAGAPALAQIGGAKPLQIGLKSLKFTPSKAKAKTGQTINFVWKENVAHNVIFDKKGPKSKTLSKGLWSTKFAKAGTYKYNCTLHPGMKGEITVAK